MSLARNILYNAGATAIGSLIQMVLVLGMARWLGLADFAAFITATAVVGFGEMASDFGMRIWGTRKFAVESRPDGVLGTILIPKSVFSLLLLLCVISLPIQLLSIEQAVLAALVACTQPSTDPLLWYLRGKERLDVEALVTLSWRVTNALAMGMIAWSGQSVTMVLLAWLVSNFLRWGIEWRLPFLASLRQAPIMGNWNGAGRIFGVVRQSFPIGSAFLVMAAYQRLGVLLLGVIATADTVAHYGAAFTLVASAGFMATSITVASFPSIARAAEAEDWNQVCAIANQKLRLVAWVFLPSCLLGMFAAPWVTGLIYPPEFADSAVAMVALLPGLYISCINFALKYLMNTLHRNWMDVASVLSGIIVFVAIVISAGQSDLLKMAGVAWGLGEAAVFAVKWRVLSRDSRMRGMGLLYHLLAFLLLQGFMLLIFGGVCG